MNNTWSGGFVGVMVSFISSWCQGIIIAVIISTIIEMILPEGNIKKYIKTVIGVYIVFTIISPIITKITGKEIDLSSYILPESQQYETVAIDTNSYIEDTYIKNIEQDIIKNIKEKGYEVIDIEVEIEKEEEEYGNINKISLKISKQIIENNNIEPIEININNEIKETDSINSEEIKTLKEYLKENYGTEEIKINE